MIRAAYIREAGIISPGTAAKVQSVSLTLSHKSSLPDLKFFCSRFFRYGRSCIYCDMAEGCRFTRKTNYSRYKCRRFFFRFLICFLRYFTVNLSFNRDILNRRIRRKRNQCQTVMCVVGFLASRIELTGCVNYPSNISTIGCPYVQCDRMIVSIQRSLKLLCRCTFFDAVLADSQNACTCKINISSNRHILLLCRIYCIIETQSSTSCSCICL